MRLLITASGIQEYIFNISHRAAGARLRGRSAQLGIVLDRCLGLITEKFGDNFEVKRNAGSRLEIEFSTVPAGLQSYLAELQQELDEHSRRDLDAQVWFAVSTGEGKEEAHRRLAEKKLRMGQAVLQLRHGDSEKFQWSEDHFLFQRQANERGIGKDEASNLPEAMLGRDLAHSENKYVYFTSRDKGNGIPILDVYAETAQEDPREGFRLALEDSDSHSNHGLVRKRLARYAPLGGDGHLLDFDEIADKSTGAKFLGVLKADLDNMGTTFSAFSSNEQGEKHAKGLSDKLEKLFTEDLESLLKSSFADCYIVYSGGDDLFMLGPWDHLIRFVAAFQKLLTQSVKAWGYSQLTLSAGLKLAHPKSPVRFLAGDVEAALEEAKGTRPTLSNLQVKNRICVFDRIIAWDDLRKGIGRAEQFIRAIKDQGLSKGFLQRLQYYASHFRHYETGQIEGLRMVPLLQNDWHRNKVRLEEEFRAEMDSLIGLLLRPMDAEASASWREVDFATRFATYALRE